MKTEIKTTKHFWRRGNVLDIVILLLLVAAIVSIGYRYYLTQNETAAEDLDEYLITFTADGVLPGVAKTLAEDDVIYLASGEQMGVLAAHEDAEDGAAVVAVAAEQLLRDADGNYVLATRPTNDVLDITGVISCEALEENGTLLLGGHLAITPGQTLTVHTEQVTLTLTVAAIEKD